VAGHSVSSLRHNLAVVLEQVAAFNAHDAVRENQYRSTRVVFEQVPTGEVLRGHAAVAEAHARLWAAFPDFQEEVVAQAANGDRVMLEWVCTGTHRGEFLGLSASGRKLHLRGVETYRLANGLIVEQRGYWDLATWINQLTP
jgi:steroid delta-isomerase-like uncharacterized protein